jgi:hypothetical protein
MTPHVLAGLYLAIFLARLLTRFRGDVTAFLFGVRATIPDASWMHLGNPRLYFLFAMFLGYVVLDSALWPMTLAARVQIGISTFLLEVARKQIGTEGLLQFQEEQYARDHPDQVQGPEYIGLARPPAPPPVCRAWTVQCACGQWGAADEGHDLVQCVCGDYWLAPISEFAENVGPRDSVSRAGTSSSNEENPTQ